MSKNFNQFSYNSSPKIVNPTDPKYRWIPNLHSFGKDGRKDQYSSVPGPGSYEQKK